MIMQAWLSVIVMRNAGPIALVVPIALSLTMALDVSFGPGKYSLFRMKVLVVKFTCLLTTKASMVQVVIIVFPN